MSIIQLPSGAIIEIRGLRGKEGKLLSDRDAIKNGTFLDKILSACTVNVIEASPYVTIPAKATSPDEPPRQVLDWSQVLIGDRFFTLVQIRVLSLGEMFGFKLQCSEEGCRKRFNHEISLLKQLSVTCLSAEDRAQFAAVNEFSTLDRNNKTIRYRLPVGKDEVLAMRAGQGGPDGAFMQALLQRIVSIEGEVVPRKYLEDCDFGNLLDLLASFDEHNCGVETTIEVQCPHCGSLEDIQLPFGRGFFVPSKMGTKN
jgi:hypothetical protein